MNNGARMNGTMTSIAIRLACVALATCTVARAELLFHDAVTAAPRMFTEKNDGEFKFPRNYKLFKGGVSIVKPGLTYRVGDTSYGSSNCYLVSDGVLWLNPYTQGFRYHLGRVTEARAEAGSSSVKIWVSVMLSVTGSIDQPRSVAGVSVNCGSYGLLYVGKQAGSDRFAARGYTSIARKTSHGESTTDLRVTNATAAIPFAAGVTHCVVMSFEKADEWLNWEVMVDPRTDTDVCVLRASGSAKYLPMFDGFEFDATGLKLQVDEIRVGTQPSDVMPWQATAEPAASSPPFAIPKEMLDAIVAVKSDNGEGTGFLAEYKGVTSVYSNIHLLMGTRNVKFVGHSGVQFKPVSMACASDRDIARITIANPTGAVLHIGAPAGENVPVGVYPHAEGETTFRPIFGTLVGSGPAKVETDAGFVEAQTGSPIILSNGTVVGVAALLRKANANWTNEDTPFVVTRRFGYRIDTVDKWIPVLPAWFVREGDAIAERAKFLIGVSVIMNSWARNPYVSYVPPYRWLPRGLASWATAHNDLADKTLKLARSGSGSTLKVAGKQVREDVQSLKNELTKSQRIAIARWHVPFFKECSDDLDASSAVLLKLLDLIETKCNKDLGSY